MRYKSYSLIQVFLLILSALLLSSCATFSSAYPNKMAKAKAALDQGDAKGAEKQFVDEMGKKPDGKLYLLEQGRLDQLNGNYKGSKEAYEKVISSVATSKMAAKIQVSHILQNAGAILTNDRELPYSVPDYAMTFLYPYQALNYLAENDLSGALVAIRQLTNAQYWTYQQKLMAGDLQSKYKAKTDQVGISQEKLGLDKSKELTAMFKAASKIENAYENGFGYYLAAILYQAFDNNFNNAFVSIKDAKRLLPDNPYVESTYQEIKRGFDGGQAYEVDKGRLVIIYEQGFVEPKSAFKLPLFLGRLGLQEIAVPYYSSHYPLLPPASIYVTENGKIKSKGRSAILVNTTQMATKSLSEEYSVIITREVIRLVIKSLATLEASNKAGGWGTLIGSIYSFVTAQADQRSWLLLPNNVQLYEKQFAKGHYAVDIHGSEYQINIVPNKTTLLWVTQMGAYHAKHMFVL
ncbi:COG3014 family protein [Fangia hongkongensis]|uniref:COG3014 family protein n=1 Tax=Fangia hongkongensis TaxID=270495 RepID=UPI00036FFC5B|nr:hypothetical protein [Fangia hongkongensis]MBK2123643.1 hypothetical protein [Fangia hongkongensis]